MAKKKDSLTWTRSSECLAKPPKDGKLPEGSRKVQLEHLWNINKSKSWVLDYSDKDGPTTQDFEGLQNQNI